MSDVTSIRAEVRTTVDRELSHHQSRIRTLRFEIERINEEELAPRETDLQHHQDLAGVLTAWLVNNP